jgi:Fic family protein
VLVHGLVSEEGGSAYRRLEAENLGRQYSFLRSAVRASLAMDAPVLSLELVRALHYHAMTCLHPGAGQYRTDQVEVGDGFSPPAHPQVPALMEMFAIQTNRLWDRLDPVALAAFVLWRLNNIHPFTEGNGRAARAACWFALCVKAGGWIGGDPTLPELIRAQRGDYLTSLRQVDESAWAGALDITPMQAFLSGLLDRQLRPRRAPRRP